MNLIKLTSNTSKNTMKMAALLAISFISVNSFSRAAEHTLKAGAFQQVITLDAVALPTQATQISVKPKAWNAFKIEKVLPQGSLVNKGDTLIWIDTEGLDRAIETTQKARVLEKLRLEAAQQELSELVRNTPIEMKVIQRKFDHYAENYEYYKETLRPHEVESANYNVKRAKVGLSYQKEELKQLQMMYNEDGLTEETEEIILQRTKNNVIDGQRHVKNNMRNAKFTIEVELPRKDVDWEKGFKIEKNNLESEKKNLQRNLKIKQLEVAKLVADDTKKQEHLDKLVADRKLMNFASPVDGVVHYGEFDAGEWQTEKAKKVLVKGGDVPSRLIVMSIVPVDADYQFSAFLSEDKKNLFSETQPARLKLKMNPWTSYEAVAQPAPAYPNLKHQWLVNFTAKDIMNKGVITGTKATVSIVTASAENVISIPSKAVTPKPDGTFTVMLKMAEGDPKETSVTVGRESGDKIEITGGIEAGQVIITP